MKLKKPGQLLLVALASLGAAALLSACSTLTVDFVYITSAKAAGPNNYGEVDVFEVNSESGHMRQIPTSPFPSGGRNPVAEAVSNDSSTLYVVNEDDNSVVQFTIGNDGKIYPQNTVNTPGVFPVAASVAGSNLIVADTYEPLPTCSPAAPCSGSITVFPLSKASGSATGNVPQANIPVNDCNGLDYVPLALAGSASSHIVAPIATSTLPTGSNLYVAANDTSAAAGGGYIFGFSIGSASCANSVTIPTLTALPGSPWAVGKKLSSIVQDPTGSYVYVTDSASAQVYGFAAGSGGLTAISGSPFPAGNMPSAMVIDTTGKYAFVANAEDSNVTGYSISSGSLARIASYATDTQPVAIGIDPSLNQYLYTANFLADTVSGFQVNATNGSLLNSQNSPFRSNANPTAIVAITHGSRKK